MTAHEAISRVQDLRESLALDEDLQPRGATQAFIEYLPDRESPGAPRQALAWIVTLNCRWGWARVKLDAATGAVLDVEQSG